ncbi:MAG TPA: MFS transporter [Pseudomonas sp.]
MTNKKVPAVWLLMTALILAEITSTFEASMAFAALPTLSRHFGDPVGVSWTITVFFLASAATAALCSRLGDMYGRRRVLIVVLLVAGLGSLTSALSTTLSGVVFGRTLQGITGAVLPLCIGLMRENLPAKSLSFCIGVMGGVVGVSAGLAFLVSGYILDQYDWHSMFYFSAFLAALGAIAVWSIVPVSSALKDRGKLDIVGGCLFAPAITLFLLGVNATQPFGWLHPRSGGLILLGLAVGALWVRHELKHPNPLIDVRLFKDRRIMLANLVFALAAVGPMVNPQVIMLFAQQPLWTGIGLGLSATAAGLLKQPNTLIGFVAGPLGGRIASRGGPRAAMLWGAAAMTIAWTLMLLIQDSLAVLLAVVTLHGFGIAVLYGAVANQLVEAAPAARTSEASGLSQVTRATFNAIGSQVIALLLATALINDPELGLRNYPAQSAYNLAFVFILLTSALSFIAAWMLPRKSRDVEAASVPAHQH